VLVEDQMVLRKNLPSVMHSFQWQRMP
jgi:hypothetical protein